MTTAVSIFNTWLHALGWMLVHSLWQGGVLALLAWVVIKLTVQRAAIHYRVLLWSFVVFIIACTCTFVGYASQAVHVAGAIVARLPAADAAGNYTQLQVPFLIRSVTVFVSANAPLLVCCWFPFCCYRVVKCLGGYLHVQHLCRQQVLGVSEQWNERFTRLAVQMGVTKKVKLLESALMQVPVSIGFLKPVVLVPLGMLCSIPSEQAEAVLLHELAHIRRHDYLINLLQLAAEAVFFFNPGLLWLGRQLREKREYCCDDVVMAYTDDKAHYLQALVYFSSFTLNRSDVAMGLRGSSGQLYRRISRMLSCGVPVRPVRIKAVAFATMCAVLLFAIICVAMWKPRIHAAAAAQINEATVAMDSATLAMLTGEFNTTYNHSHYRIGVAKSRITHLAVNGKTVPPKQWQYYNNAFAAIVLEFKKQMEKNGSTVPFLNTQPMPDRSIAQKPL